MRLFRLAVLLLLVAVAGPAFVQAPPGDVETPAEFHGTKGDLVLLTLDSDTLLRGRPVEGTLTITNSGNGDLEFDGVTTQTRALVLTPDTVLPVTVEAGGVRAVTYTLEAPVEGVVKYFGALAADGAVELSTREDKLTVHLRGTKPVPDQVALRLHLAPFRPAFVQVLLWSLIGLFVGFGIKRAMIWNAEMKRRRQAARAAAADDPAAPAASRPPFSWSGATIDFAITCVVGAIAVVLLLAQEPTSFTSYIGAAGMGLGVGGLGDDAILRRIFSSQGATA